VLINQIVHFEFEVADGLRKDIKPRGKVSHGRNETCPKQRLHELAVGYIPQSICPPSNRAGDRFIRIEGWKTSGIGTQKQFHRVLDHSGLAMLARSLPAQEQPSTSGGRFNHKQHRYLIIQPIPLQARFAPLGIVPESAHPCAGGSLCVLPSLHLCPLCSIHLRGANAAWKFRISPVENFPC
jgi:hypothetical protein